MVDVSKPDAKVQDILTDVEQLELELVEGQSFKNETVYFDGRSFKDCTFRDCRVFIKLGAFRIHDCNLINCNFIMDGPANSLKNFVDMVYKQQGELREKEAP